MAFDSLGRYIAAHNKKKRPWALIGRAKDHHIANKIADVHRWDLVCLSSSTIDLPVEWWRKEYGSRFNVSYFPIHEKRTDWKNIKREDVIVNTDPMSFEVFKATSRYGCSSSVGPIFYYEPIDWQGDYYSAMLPRNVPSCWFFFTPLSLDNQSTEEPKKCTCDLDLIMNQGCVCNGK